MARILLLGGITLWWMVSGGDSGEIVAPAIVPRSVPLGDADLPPRDARPIATEPLPSEEEIETHPASGRWLLLEDEADGLPIAGATVEVFDVGVLEQSDAAILHVEARLVLENLPAGASNLWRVASGRPDVGGCVRLGLPHPGRYSLGSKRWSRTDPASWYRLDLGPDPEITIPRGTTDHVLSLDIDPQLLNLRMRQLFLGG